jgi:hypothetical protein
MGSGQSTPESNEFYKANRVPSIEEKRVTANLCF